MTYAKRISDDYLKGDYVDGSILQHTDMNELESVAKEGINANYVDIQKLQDGTLSVKNATNVSGASLSKSTTTLEDSDEKIPTSKQVKDYVDNHVTPSQDIPFYFWDGVISQANVNMFNEICGLYNQNKPFMLFAKVMVLQYWDSVDDHTNNYVVTPIQVKNYTEYEQEGQTQLSFTTAPIFTGNSYMVGSIKLTGTWGAFTAIENLTWSMGSGAAPVSYVDEKLTKLSGYSSTATQVLKNINGVLQWVNES